MSKQVVYHYKVYKVDPTTGQPTCYYSGRMNVRNEVEERHATVYPPTEVCEAVTFIAGIGGVDPTLLRLEPVRYG